MALGFMVLLVICAVFSPLLTAYDPLRINPVVRLLPPSMEHILGTDSFGRDVFSRTIYGTRQTLITGASIVGFSVFFGVFIGAMSGYFRRLGAVLMRLMDILMSFPDIMLALALMAIFGRGLFNVIIAIGIVFTPRIARLMYGLTLEIRETTYVESARALGVSNWRIITHYIIINALSPIIVQASFTFAFCIIAVASLDFLGVGVPPYIPSWGGIVSEGRTYLTRAPWIMTFPGIAIVLTTLSLNLVGDALRDALDPRLRRLL
ncbi:MAG TPA: ABC transporter permease [Candidatus Acetothermia bacterium]|nr:ABC transporter permease [Candidatus Acetothermia bacterium]